MNLLGELEVEIRARSTLGALAAFENAASDLVGLLDEAPESTRQLVASRLGWALSAARCFKDSAEARRFVLRVLEVHGVGPRG